MSARGSGALHNVPLRGRGMSVKGSLLEVERVRIHGTQRRDIAARSQSYVFTRLLTKPSGEQMTEHQEVRVPSQLRDPDPVIAALRDDKRHFPLTGSARSRALRILQGLVSAAHSRGWKVKAIEYGHNFYEHRGSNDHLLISTGATDVHVRMFQQTDRSPHEPTPGELEHQKRWGTRPPKYDHAPNEYLRLELNRSWDSTQHSWSEGKRGPLEAKLGTVVLEIERRHAAAAGRDAQRAAQADERLCQHQIAIERATEMLAEWNRAQVLADQVSRWNYVSRLQEYIEAMRRVADRLVDPVEQNRALAWIEWASRHADAINPLRQALGIPSDPEPTADALAPFLRQLGGHGTRSH